MINQDKNTPDTIGKRIKLAREKAGLTQSELAIKLGYTTPTAVSLIEDDKRSVKVETLQKIADELHQDVNYIASGQPVKTSVKTALRADANFDSQDLKQIENFIDYLMSQKDKDGRGSTEK